MKILGFNISREKRAAEPQGKAVHLPMFGYRSIGTGNPETEVSDPNGALAISAVFACVRLLSTQLASLPVHLYADGENGRKNRLQNHPAYKVFARIPNGYQTSHDFRKALYASAYMYGNGIAYITRDASARPIKLQICAPGDVTIADNGEDLYYIIQLRTPSGALKGRVTAHCDDVIHIQGVTLDGIVGVDIIKANASNFGVALAAQQFVNQYFTNGATLGGVVEHPLVLGDEGLKNLRNSIEQRNSGTNGAGSILTLEEGAKFHELSNSMDKAGATELRRYQTEDIARIFGVPLALLGDTKGQTVNNVENLVRLFVTSTLATMIEQTEAQIDRKLLTDRDFMSERVWFEHDFTNLLRADAEATSKLTETMAKWGLADRNELRKIANLNLEPEEANYTLIPMNMQAVPAGEMPVQTHGSASPSAETPIEEEGSEDEEDEKPLPTPAPKEA
jgi:HK97 family phage portal protein